MKNETQALTKKPIEVLRSLLDMFDVNDFYSVCIRLNGIDLQGDYSSKKLENIEQIIAQRFPSKDYSKFILTEPNRFIQCNLEYQEVKVKITLT